MNKLGRTGEQERFIELNKQFMDEVERGASWSELRWLIEEMKDIAKDFEHLEPARIIAMNHNEQSSPMERDR